MFKKMLELTCLLVLWGDWLTGRSWIPFFILCIISSTAWCLMSTSGSDKCRQQVHDSDSLKNSFRCIISKSTICLCRNSILKVKVETENSHWLLAPTRKLDVYFFFKLYWFWHRCQYLQWRVTGKWGRERVGKTHRKGLQVGSWTCNCCRTAAPVHRPPAQTTKPPSGSRCLFLSGGL